MVVVGAAGVSGSGEGVSDKGDVGFGQEGFKSLLGRFPNLVLGSEGIDGGGALRI
jgi:hypothetical protein